MNPIKRKFKLRPRARLIKTLGEELISRDAIAITELVKNSYDADAVNVRIILSGNLKVGLGKLEIHDDGHGMSENEVLKGWMEPASVAKVSQRKSVKGRPFLGQKGIGRFSAAKLATKLTLISKKNQYPEVEAEFEWSHYDDSEKYLDEVEGFWLIRDEGIIKGTGTHLILEGLNAVWDAKKILDLRTQLSRLINPLSPVQDFHISLELPSEFEQYAGEVSAPASMERPDYGIHGELSAVGHLLCEFNSKKQLSKKIVHNGKVHLEDGMIPVCGHITFEFRVWDRDRLKDLAVATSSTVSEVRRDLDDIAGISIYRDGFRVTPYGNPQNDWLRLDIRRVLNPTMRLSNNQVVGEISITDIENPELRDQSNRDGIVDSEAFDDLREIVKFILNLLEQERYKERRQIELDDSDQKNRLFRSIDLDTVRAVVEKKMPGDEEIKKVVEEKEKEINERVEELRDFIVRYRRLSTLGQLVDVILHDAGAALTRIINGLAIIEKERTKSSAFSATFEKNLRYVTEGSNMMKELFKRLAPFGGRKRQAVIDLVVERAIKDIFDLYSKEIDELKVSFEIPETETYYRAVEADFKMVFVNLLTNSLYWLKKVSEDKRQIVVRVVTEGKLLRITFSDSGPGVSSEDSTYIFEPYFTKKPGGSGLGLTIVGEYVSENNGLLDLLEKSELGGASFRITLPFK